MLYMPTAKRWSAAASRTASSDKTRPNLQHRETVACLEKSLVRHLRALLLRDGDKQGPGSHQSPAHHDLHRDLLLQEEGAQEDGKNEREPIQGRDPRCIAQLQGSVEEQVRGAGHDTA